MRLRSRFGDVWRNALHSYLKTTRSHIRYANISSHFLLQCFSHNYCTLKWPKFTAWHRHHHYNTFYGYCYDLKVTISSHCWLKLINTPFLHCFPSSKPALLSSWVFFLSDLEAEFLHSVPPPPQTPPTQGLSSTLDVYIDKSKTAAATKEAEVPACVSKVLELLPDFSYLRKSILAFPVLDQTD